MSEAKDKLKHLILDEIGFQEAIKLCAEIGQEERENLARRASAAKHPEVRTELYNRSLKMGNVEIFDEVFEDCSATYYQFSFGH